MDQLSKFSLGSTKVSNIFMLNYNSGCKDLHLIFRKKQRHVVLEYVEGVLSSLV